MTKTNFCKIRRLRNVDGQWYNNWYNIRQGWVNEIKDGTSFEVGAISLKKVIKELKKLGKIEVVEYVESRKY